MMNKDNRYINELLEKFYDGISTPEEEEILSRFFSEAERVPEEFLADMKVFQAMAESLDNVAVPENLAGKIIAGIDSTSAARKSAGFGKFRRRTLYYGAVAAIMALLMIPLVLKISSQEGQNKEEVGKVKSVKPAQQRENNHIAATEPNETVAAEEKPEEAKALPQNKIVVNRYAAQSRIPPKAGKSIVANGETETPVLSEEELKAINAGLEALGKAGKQFAYARGRMESADRAVDKSLNEIRNILIN